jgi:hypothetical protein
MARRIPDEATIDTLLSEASSRNISDLCDLRDGVHLMKAAEFGFDIFSLDRKISTHKSHFCISLEGFDRMRESEDLTELKKHRFVEISVDFVWMPCSYLYDTVLTKSFFSTTLPILSTVLEDYARLYFPATKPLFERLVHSWQSLSDSFILRFIRHDQLEDSCLYRATLALPMKQFGK